MDKKLVEFLIKAKQATYAGKGAETTSSRVKSHDLIYKDGDYMYYDTYLGTGKFAGEEALWVKDAPFWSMNYIGSVNMASKIRLSRTQLPEIYDLLPEICVRLDIPEPEFYLEMNPNPNAYTFGDTQPFIVINSGLIDLLRQDELKTVIAHECGHILCHHVLYHTLADHLLNLGTGLIGDLKDIVVAPLKWALLYWVRRSEFSADRVAAFVMENSEVVVRTMMRTAGGKSEITKNVNVEEFLQQAITYKNTLDESKFSKLLQAIAIKDQTHPYTAIRALEVRDWFRIIHSQLPEPTDYDRLFQSVKLINKESNS